MQKVSLLDMAMKKRRGNPRIMTYKVNLLKILERMKNPPHTTGKIDYTRYTYCKGCDIKTPLGIIFCPDCGRRVRHRPNSKQAKYWNGKLKYYD